MLISTETNGNAPKKLLTLQHLLQAGPDLVERIFDYILSESPATSAQVQKCKDAVRKEFAGGYVYISARSATDRQQKIIQVRNMFNGRNAPEVASRMGISRATVYRYITQPSGR